MGNLEELIEFTSLGMLILDEVHLPCGKVVENVIGGSGSYGKCPKMSGPPPYTNMATMMTSTASLGARLFSPKNQSTQVGWTIRKGHDFPAETLRQLETWGMTLSVIQENGRRSTRGQLKYLDPAFASNASTSTRLQRWGSDNRLIIQPNPSNTPLQP